MSSNFIRKYVIAVGLFFFLSVAVVAFENVDLSKVKSSLTSLRTEKFDFSKLPKIVFVSEDNQEITSFLDETGIEKKDQVRILDEHTSLWEISPNGKYYVYRKSEFPPGQGEKQFMGVAEIDGQKNIVIENLPLIPGIEFRWSPDSRYLSWTEDNNLKILDVTKENSKIDVFKYPCTFHNWSIDSKNIVCKAYKDNNLYVIDVEKYINFGENSIKKIVIPEKIAAEISGWSELAMGTDEKHMLFAQKIQDHGFNIIQFEVDSNLNVTGYHKLNSNLINTTVYGMRYTPDQVYILYVANPLAGIGVIDTNSGINYTIDKSEYPDEETIRYYINQGSSPFNNEQNHAPDWFVPNDMSLNIKTIISSENLDFDGSGADNSLPIVAEQPSKITPYDDDLIQFSYDSKYFFPVRKKEIEKDRLIGYYEIIPYAQPKEENYFFKDITISLNKNEVSATNDTYIESWTSNAKKSSFDPGKLEKIKLGNYEFVKNMTPDKKAIFYVSFSNNYFIQISSYSTNKGFADDGVRRIEELISSITYRQ